MTGKFMASALAAFLLAGAGVAQANETGAPKAGCVLGAGGQCEGAVRVLSGPLVTTGPGPQRLQPVQGMTMPGGMHHHHAHMPMHAPTAAHVMTAQEMAQPATAYISTPAPVTASAPVAGCIPAPAGQPYVHCNGRWVPVTAAPVQPVHVPVPVQDPPPMVVAAAPGPEVLGYIQPGFFLGPIRNGVGFNTETSYVYGGGGAVFLGGGGSRFSGVAGRSPFPLVPPARHRPAPKHHHGGCGGCGH